MNPRQGVPARRAASTAQRVLPIPPGPVMVITGSPSSTSETTSAITSSRPTRSPPGSGNGGSVAEERRGAPNLTGGRLAPVNR